MLFCMAFSIPPPPLFLPPCFDIGPVRPAISIKDELEQNNQSYRPQPYARFLSFWFSLSFIFLPLPIHFPHFLFDSVPLGNRRNRRKDGSRFSTIRIVLLLRVLLDASRSSARVSFLFPHFSPLLLSRQISFLFAPQNNRLLAVYVV